MRISDVPFFCFPVTANSVRCCGHGGLRPVLLSAKLRQPSESHTRLSTNPNWGSGGSTRWNLLRFAGHWAATPLVHCGTLNVISQRGECRDRAMKEDSLVGWALPTYNFGGRWPTLQNFFKERVRILVVQKQRRASSPAKRVFQFRFCMAVE